MKSILFSTLCLAFLAVCLGGTFQVVGPIDADSTSYALNFPYVPDHGSMIVPNIEDYYLHIEYNANIINPVGLFVNQVYDQPMITGIPDVSSIPGQPYFTNDDNFTQSEPFPTITPLVAQPDILAELAASPPTSVQGTLLSLILTMENVGTRRPVNPTAEFTIPGDFIDFVGASANRPNVTIFREVVGGDHHFIITWYGALVEGAASDVDITIDLFVHDEACQEYADLNAASVREARQANSSNSTSASSSSSAASSNSTSSNDTSSSSSSSASSTNCPPLDTVDNGTNIPDECRPQPNCPDAAELDAIVAARGDGVCGAFCIQGVIYPNYDNFTIGRQTPRMIIRRNFVNSLTDDPNEPGAADPTIVFFATFIPGGPSSSLPEGEESSSLDLVIILLPLFLGLLLLCCLAILIAALLAALWWFLTGREKMRTRVQWIPGRNKGGDGDEGL